MHLLVDSTSIKFLGDGEWKRKKHGACDTRGCHEVIAQVWKSQSAGAKVRNEAVLACKRLGRRIWKVWSGYHRRSLVETQMHCFKRLGERVMARTFERQVVALHVQVALLNRFSQRGRPVTVVAA